MAIFNSYVTNDQRVIIKFIQMFDYWLVGPESLRMKNISQIPRPFFFLPISGRLIDRYMFEITPAMKSRTCQAFQAL